jgi:hypothetical protein
MARAANSRPTWAKVLIAPPDLADQFVGQVIDLPGYFLAERGEEAVLVADGSPLFRQPSRPVPLGYHGVPVQCSCSLPG